MSTLKPLEVDKVVIKTEPVDSFEWESQHAVSQADHNSYTQQHVKHKESEKEIFTFNAAEIAEKLKNIKRNSSSQDESYEGLDLDVGKESYKIKGTFDSSDTTLSYTQQNAVRESSLSVQSGFSSYEHDDVFSSNTMDIRKVENLKRQSLRNAESSHSKVKQSKKNDLKERNKSQFHTFLPKRSGDEDNSNITNSVDLKPTVEELEDYSRSVSKSNSAHSLSGDNSLGKTLATSLQLIATNNATSPLIPSPAVSTRTTYR
ncbi:unnamed protein product, partial [Lymnaea stagnalis]